MRIGKHYLVCGRVQGVGYRYFAVETALRLGVSGYVRNLPDGTVEVHAEASPGVLVAFRAELEHGPAMSRVSEIVERDIEVRSYASFEWRS